MPVLNDETFGFLVSTIGLPKPCGRVSVEKCRSHTHTRANRTSPSCEDLGGLPEIAEVPHVICVSPQSVENNGRHRHRVMMRFLALECKVSRSNLGYP